MRRRRRTNNKVINRSRILLVVTDTSPLRRLWQAVEEQLSGTCTEVLALFVDDERWRRAASLPFTREVSRVSGTDRDFTARRAAQIDRDTVGRVQARIQALATNAELQFAFEVLSKYKMKQIHDFVRVEGDVLIASSNLKNQPISNELTRLNCRTLFIDSEE